MTKRNEEKFAYLSGILDSSRGNITDNGLITVTHESLVLMDWLKDNIGGQYNDANQRGEYVWWLNPEESRPILEQISSEVIRHQSTVRKLLS